MENFLSQFLGTLLGGILAILGGVLSIWFQVRSARRIKMDEVVAEKKIKNTLRISEGVLVCG